MKKVLVVGQIDVDVVLQGYQESPIPGKEVLVDDSSMVLGGAAAIFATGPKAWARRSRFWARPAMTPGDASASTPLKGVGSTSPRSGSRLL
jgi:hypothetical protein